MRRPGGGGRDGGARGHEGARGARPAPARTAPRHDSSVTPAELAEMRRELGEAVPDGPPADVTRVCLRLPAPSGAPMVERETLAVLVSTADRREAERAARAAARTRGLTGEV